LGTELADTLAQDRGRRKIAPRSDLSQEEKVFMFNWNVHLRNRPVHADAQARAALILQMVAFYVCSKVQPKSIISSMGTG